MSYLGLARGLSYHRFKLLYGSGFKLIYCMKEMQVQVNEGSSYRKSTDTFISFFTKVF